ncbi:alpha/beta fold hydrolase [Candidatus Dependentiae bacterium]
MNANKIVSLLSIIALVLTISGCRWFFKKIERETIFDRVVSIPKDLVLDIPYLPPLCDKIPGLKKGYVDIDNGGRLYYEEQGQGIPIVLINGGPGCTHHSFHPYFSQIKDIARVIYYDQRGTGKSSSDNTGKTYTIKQAVQDLESLRKALKIDKWVVLGWSYGGLLAQCYALTYPEHCTGLILVASTSGVVEPVTKAVRNKMFLSQVEVDAIGDINKKFLAGNITSIQELYNKLLSGDWKKQGYYKPTQNKMVRAARYEWQPTPGFREVIQVDANKINLAGKFDDFEIPTLITEAKWDLMWWNPDRAEIMRKNHPHARLEMFEKSGHAIFADEPKKFFDLAKMFVKQSSKKKIAIKPGNRLEWPEPMSDLGFKLKMAALLEDKTKKDNIFLDVYEQALRENITDSSVWNNLSYHFICKKDAEKALLALERLESSLEKEGPNAWRRWNYLVKAWQGHMLDLLGRRQEALVCYKESLKVIDGRSTNMPNMMVINKEWLEKRLESHFSWEQK